MDSNQEIYNAIPHRPPFLWVDAVISFDSQTMIAEKYIDPDLDLFKGHYPGYAIMPGVLLCEAVFQTGALFMAKTLEISGTAVKSGHKLPVLTRIKNARFKREVKPGDTIRMQVSLDENIGDAWFFKGKALLDSQVAVKVDFSCALIKQK